MEQPDGHAVSRKENWVWKLKKGLYRLLQARRTWNEELNSHMEGVGYAVTSKDPAIYARGFEPAAGGFRLSISLG